MSSRYRLLSARINGFRQHAKVRGWRAKRRAELIVVQQDTAEVRMAMRGLKAIVDELSRQHDRYMLWTRRGG